MHMLKTKDALDVGSMDFKANRVGLYSRRSTIGDSSVAEGSMASQRQGAEHVEVCGEVRNAREAEARNSR